MSKNDKKNKLHNQIEKEWTDKEVLENFGKFLDRVSVATSFLTNDDGAITHSVVMFKCGDKVLVSDPSEFEWPLMLMPKPEALADV